MSEGRFFKFESMATADGTGIRAAVFLSGCPLRCVYCHNPEGWSADAGEVCSSEELARKILRFKPYFGADGGATFSGGEPLLQARFAADTAEILRAEGVESALDTSGAVFNEEVKRLVGLCGLVIADLKFYDADGYEKYADCYNFDTICRFLEFVKTLKKRLWLRTVIVPGINDDEADIRKYAAFARGLEPEKYELSGFHTMGFGKYRDAGIDNPLEGTPALPPARLSTLQALADALISEREN